MGWAYVSGKGRGGSHFARLRNAEPQARMPAVPAQNDTGNDTKLLGTGCLYSGLEPVEIVGPELSSILQQEYERFLQPAIKAESKPLWITNPREPQAMLVDHEAQGAAPPTSSAREYSLRNRRWLDVHDIYDFQFRGRCPARIR